MKTVSRACVFKMYHTHAFSLDSLKQLFLFDSQALKENCVNTPIKSCVENWIEKMGPMDQTMHWSEEKLYCHICRMLRYPHSQLLLEFQTNSKTDSLTTGVMDIMFLASCFQLPLVCELGPRFWFFTKELIHLRVSSVDHLNSLLWGLVLPQTVILLDPKPYFMDSDLEAISVDITIKGSKGGASAEEETVIVVHSKTSLVFIGSVRLVGLKFKQQRHDPNQSEYSDTVLSFIGWGDDKLLLFMKDVQLVNAGCSVSAYNRAHFCCVSVTDALIGIHVTNVKDVFLSSGDMLCPGTSFDPPGFFYCDTAIVASDVSVLIAGHQIISHCHTVFDLKVKHTCVVEESTISSCDHMGKIMTSPNCTPSLIGVSVSAISFFFY